ncbi:MAG: 30S ribosomal protein S17 [Deltaproteobacteria bacterium]|jgi:small subunit ribosomal protein S17|nr:30S ribosomal protein S17 [Deltaproteobacteria bacterium]
MENLSKKMELVGEVVSNKMQKTISVSVSRVVKHVKYGKYLKKSTVFKAHDEKNDSKIGDKVLIRESRPLSRTKRWELVKILK